ncbi:MAG: universal stress protein [Phycisphaerales bacterium]
MLAAPAPVRAMTSLVVGIDFTPCCAVALGQAIRIAAWSGGGGGATVHPVHVIDTIVVLDIEAALSDFQQNIRDSLARDAQRAWGEFAKGVRGAAGLPLEVSVNNRIVGILRRARQAKADLLVMGAFGWREPDVGFGTVATACVRKSMTDVLLVRDTRAGAFKTIVACVDFSPTSLRVLERAAFFASKDDAELHVLHVCGTAWQQLHHAAPTPLVEPHQMKRYRDSVEHRLAEFARPVLARYPGLRSRSALHDQSGHRSGIVAYAKSVSADLIVLGTRGRTSLRDILLGSTAEKALEESPCSVLAVKPEGFEHPLAAEAEPRNL